MSSVNPDDNLTPAEIASLARLESTVERGLRTYMDVGKALAEIRDRHLYVGTHRSFETYVSNRWGGGQASNLLPPPASGADVRPASGAEPTVTGSVDDGPCEALAKACEHTLRTLRAGDLAELDIRLTVGKSRDEAAPAERPNADPGLVAKLVGDELFPTLRWLLTQAAGTIADAAHRLETDAAGVDDHARAQLADDVLTLEEELAVLKGLLGGPVDWDADFERLLDGEIAPLDDDGAEDDD